MKILIGFCRKEWNPDSCRRLLRFVSDSYRSESLTLAIPESTPNPDEVRDQVQTELAKYDLESEVTLLGENPAARLVDLAEKHSFDLIVLDGGRRTPMGKYRLGQTAEFVVMNSRVSVSLVR